MQNVPVVIAGREYGKHDIAGYTLLLSKCNIPLDVLFLENIPVDMAQMSNHI